MKNFDLNKYRQENVELLLYGGSGVGTNNGVFIIPYQGRNLAVIASDGDGWEHVSVSLPNRCPNWPEMCFIKNLFWNDDEVVVQIHPAKSDYVNNHPYCLHLWKCKKDNWIELPPSEMVGIKELSPDDIKQIL